VDKFEAKGQFFLDIFENSALNEQFKITKKNCSFIYNNQSFTIGFYFHPIIKPEEKATKRTTFEIRLIIKKGMYLLF
jgi:hypothetical protein